MEKVRAAAVIVSSSPCQRWLLAVRNLYVCVFPVVSSRPGCCTSSGGSEEESAVQTPSVLHPRPHQLQEVHSPEEKTHPVEPYVLPNPPPAPPNHPQTNGSCRITVTAGDPPGVGPSAPPPQCPGGGVWGPSSGCWGGAGEEARLRPHTHADRQVRRPRPHPELGPVSGSLQSLSTRLPSAQVHRRPRDHVSQQPPGRRHGQAVLPEAADAADPGLRGVRGSGRFQEPGAGPPGYKLPSSLPVSL